MNNDIKIQKLRIHGDNILECERALKLIISALEVKDKDVIFVGEAAFSPVYRVSKDSHIFEIKLFPGYERWGINLKDYLINRGAVLREATDAIVTRLIEKDGKLNELPLLSLEFCGALPAGNNAWQRCGRALASAYSKVPYLYFAEIGGAELDVDRKIKASRFPNPLVPFSYLALGDTEETIAIPVFVSSASLDDAQKNLFEKYFGLEEASVLVKNILLGDTIENTAKKLKDRAASLISTLASFRKRNDCLHELDWDILIKKQNGLEKAKWLIQKEMSWHKKIGLKTVTRSFQKLLKITKKAGAVAVGSKDMPFCLIPSTKRPFFSEQLKKIYHDRIDKEFSNWISNNSGPLICVWIAGFKPRGDDSRPDRGLVPLARMTFGRKNIDLLTIVYGPAKPNTWKSFKNDIRGLAESNGLWEAILRLSNAVLVDTPTNKKMRNIGRILVNVSQAKKNNILVPANDQPNFGEQDVDSVIHCLFSNATKYGVYEGLCNPPGGDWSGINIIDFNNMCEYKWTSLPRVSEKDTKRPDHLVQFRRSDILLSIESKDTASTLENAIGLRLKKYVNILIKHQPISHRKQFSEEWKLFKDNVDLKRNIISGAAFRLTNQKDIFTTLKRGMVDIVFGIEFLQKSNKVIIHVLACNEAVSITPIIKNIGERYSDLWEIRFVKS